MKTPITEAALERIALDCDDSCLPIYVYVDGKEYTGGAIDADTARKLELDRAALMAIAVRVANDEELPAGGDMVIAILKRDARAALAAARANFPDAE
jgi:hypothetical protein